MISYPQAYLRGSKPGVKTAFTLIEILIAVAIIGLIAAIAIYNFTAVRENAAGAAVGEDLRVLREAVDIFRIDHNRYPDNWDELKPYIKGMSRIREAYELNTEAGSE